MSFQNVIQNAGQIDNGSKPLLPEKVILNAVSLPVIVAEVNHGTVIFANQEASSLFGIPMEQVEGQVTPDFFAEPKDREHYIRLLKIYGRVMNAEFEMKKGDGSIFWASLTTEATEYQGVPVTVTMVQDITEKKQAEDTLQETEERFRQMFEGALIGIFRTTLDGLLLEGNQALLDVSGYDSIDEINQIGLWNLYADPAERQEMLKAIQTQGQIKGHEIALRGKNGEIVPLSLSARVVLDKGGKPSYLDGTLEDITVRKQAEAHIRESEERYQDIFDASPVMFWLKDAENNLLQINQAAADFEGVDPKNLEGRSCYDLYPQEQAEAFYQDDLKVIQSGTPKLGIIEKHTAPGTGNITWVETGKVPIRDKKGGVSQVLAIAVDITERMQLEEQVQEGYERRGYQVQVSTEIAQDIAQASDLSELFEQVVVLTKERLGYYHTQLLRYNAAQDSVILITGYGEIGQTMAAEGHRMPMGTGLIGAAAAKGETMMRPDLAQDPDWRPNPLLPDTLGEIAVPIKLGEDVLGILDVQSDIAGALTDDDRLLLEGLCGQIAVAMEQTRLRQEMAIRLDEINRLYMAMNREGWQAYRSSASMPVGFQYDQADVHPMDDTPLLDELFAKIPLTMPGGQVFGELGITDDPDMPLSDEDKAFLEQVSEQVALALESARLFEQAQTRSEELNTLNEMGRTLTSLQDEQAIYETIFDYTGRLMDVTSFFIGIYDHEKHEIALPVYNELGQRVTVPDQSTGNGLTNHIIQTRQPLLISTDFDARVRELGIDYLTIGDDNPALSWLGVPLVFQDRILGIISVQSDTTPGLYTNHELDLLTSIASQAAIALENAAAFRKTQQQATQEATINLISQRIQSTTSVESALQVAIRELGKALGAKRANVQLGIPSQHEDK